MREFAVLKFLDLFASLFRAFGVDYPVMRKIVQVKLTLDDRKPPTFQNSNKPKKETTNGYIKSLWIYALFGLILIPFMSFGDNYIFQMSLTFAIIMFLVMTTLISEFSSVLLDVRDQSILLTKPVNSRTLNAAKLIHVCIYMGYLTIMLTGIPVIVTFVNKGILFGLLTIFTIVLMDLLIVVLTAILYIAILSVFDGEKLKDMINYVQIGLALALMIGYQVLVRAFEFTDFSYTLDPAWWHVFLIPMWFAAPYELLFADNGEMILIVLTVLALIVPFVAIWLYVKLIPTFERNLQKLLSTSKSKVEKQNKVKAFILSLICRTKQEQAFYRFSSIMMKQERDFKLKVYPSLGFSIVIPFIFMFNSWSIGDLNFATSKVYFFIYFSMIVIPSAVMLLQHSVKYKAAWVYQLFPLANFSSIKKGTIKAFLIKLYLPLFIVIAIVFTFLFGVRVIPDMIGMLLSSFLYALICYELLGDSLPFTKSTEQMGAGQGAKTFALFIPLGIIAAVHIAITSKVVYGSWIFVAMMLVANLVCWNVLFKQKNELKIVGH